METQEMEDFCLALTPVPTPFPVSLARLAVFAPFLSQSPQWQAAFLHVPRGGDIAVLFFIAISFADLWSDSESTIGKTSSHAIDSGQF